MTKERFSELIRITGAISPKGLEDHIDGLEAADTELLPEDTLRQVLDENAVPSDLQKNILDALAQVNACRELVELSHIMAQDAVRALIRCTANEFFQPKPDCLQGFARDAYAFLFTQLCVLEGRKALRARGVPEAYDRDIPERMTRKQLRKYVETGDINFDDYPWDINFYCCAIFLLDRFYFIPYRWEEPPQAWRSNATGRVVALWKGGVKARTDGQLDGVNKVTDPRAFITVYEETEDAVTAHPVDPAGVILPEPVTLRKAEWTKALGQDDYLLALHIPGGPGYTPERVKHSCELALAFYEQYFPEYHYLGFWSESWLYDPGLASILDRNRNIIRVQRQFYCYPTMEGDDMARREVLHDSKADYRQFTAVTALEKGMFAAWDRGEHFHTTGMFLLKEEVPQVGTDPYRKDV